MKKRNSESRIQNGGRAAPRVAAFWILASGFWLSAQTAINLKTQASDVDFTLLSPTKPFQMGASLPGTCAQGSMFFLTGVTNGQNVYGCPVTNTWALEGGNSNSGAGVWGQITGTLSNQTDLASALAGKQASLGFTPLNAANNLSDLANATTAQTNLGLGAAALLGAVTSVGSPGSDSDVPTEAAVRSAISAASSGVTGPVSSTSGYLAAWANNLGTSLGVGLPTSATPGASTVPQSGAGGTLAAGWLPPPGASTLGGVESKDCSTLPGLVQKINVDGSVTCASASSSGGTLTIQVGGTAAGAEAALNFVSGNGVTWVCTDNPAVAINCTGSLNTAYALTIALQQSGAPTFCNSTNGTTIYTCSLSAAKALTAYTEGSEMFLLVDTTCASTCSLNIDGLGALTITRADGMTAPGGALVAGRPQPVWYDGAIFRLVNE